MTEHREDPIVKRHRPEKRPRYRFYAAAYGGKPIERRLGPFDTDAEALDALRTLPPTTLRWVEVEW